MFFLRWFVPQLTCYGLIALFTALLNTRGKFAAPMFVPIANNLVLIVVLLWFHALVPHPSLATVDAHHSAWCCWPSAPLSAWWSRLHCWLPRCCASAFTSASSGSPPTRPCAPSPGCPAGPSAWVLANQIALVIILALADGVKVPGAVSAYTYAYRFFQLPYGIVAVSVMSAVTPSLAGPLGPTGTWPDSGTGWPSGCGASWPSSFPPRSGWCCWPTL